MQQNGSKYLPAEPYPTPSPPPEPGVVVNVKILFFRIWSCVAYQIKEFHKCSNMVANILPTDPPPPPLGMGSVGQTSTSSEHGHVACQIKRNHEMQQQDCMYFARTSPPSVHHPPPPPPTLGMGSIVHASTFKEYNHVAYPINGNHELQQH